MRDAIHKLTLPILSRLPDPSHEPARRQVMIGITASLAVHLFVLLLALLFGRLLDFDVPEMAVQTAPEEEEIELLVMPPEEEEKARTVPLAEILRPPPFMDSLGLASSPIAPEHPIFESDVDMVAASEAAPTGTVPLPSQAGRESEFPMFTNQRVSLGANPVPFPMDTSLKSAPPDKPAPPPKAAPPVATPAPQLAKLQTPVRPRFKAVSRPRDEEVAVERAAEPTPAPAAPAPAVAAPQLRANFPAAEAQPTPAPQPRAPGGFQEEQHKTKIEGSISNRGVAAVDALGTPLGRYEKAAKTAIASRWYFYVNANRGMLFPGSLTVSLVIQEDGRIRDLELTSNTSNSVFEEVCRKAVMETELPPMPPAVLDALQSGQLDMSFRFILNADF